MSCLWILKPLNVQDHTIINFKGDLDLPAFLLQLLSTSTKDHDKDFSALLHPTGKQANRGFKSKKTAFEVWQVDDEPEFWRYNSPRPLHREVDNDEGLPKFQPAHQQPSESKPLQAHYSHTISNSTGITKHYPIGGIRKLYEPVSGETICCKIFSGQTLPSGIGPAFPHFAGAARNDDTGLAFGEFVDVVSLSGKDLKRLELVSTALPLAWGFGIGGSII
jgi:hypothetical protein